MRPIVTRWLALSALAVLCALPLGAAAELNRPTRPVAATSVAAEPHPEINAAIRALKRARQHLERAAHDFGGHRAEAIQAIDAALVQLQQALQYDKK